jgi:hypothetical protein
MRKRQTATARSNSHDILEEWQDRQLRFRWPDSLRRLALLLCLARAAGAEEIFYSQVPPGLLQERLARVTGDNRTRSETLRQLFIEAGCPVERLTEPRVGGSKLPNIICRLPGESSAEVVVGAHYDKVWQGLGAVDNWSGTVLLTALYQSLATHPRKLTFVFAGFSDEEKGLVGSRSFVKDLSKSEASVRAMVNIDSVGMTSPKVWATRSDPRLLQWAFAVAKAAKVPLTGVSVDQVGDFDPRPFKEKKIPVIDFHSLMPHNLDVLHTTKYGLAQIKPEDYAATYSLLAMLLAYLDTKLGAL